MVQVPCGTPYFSWNSSDFILFLNVQYVLFVIFDFSKYYALSVIPISSNISNKILCEIV